LRDEPVCIPFDGEESNISVIGLLKRVTGMDGGSRKKGCQLSCPDPDSLGEVGIESFVE
jgi:hypothetical protein